MGERTSYEPGTFCAVDLMTPDRVAAKDFYGGLFGWEHDDIPEAGYTVAMLGGKAVAGMFDQPEDQRGHAPPSWLSYVSVEDADETAGRARELGATVLREPEEVAGAGRVGVIADPQGAVFALWQPLNFAGAALVNDPGAFSLNQLNTPDPEAARSFYGDLFGWRTEYTGTGADPKDSASVPNPPQQDYWGFYVGERVNGGLMPLPEAAGAPPHWLAYFTSADLDASLEQVAELGGSVLVPVTPIGVGRIAVAADPLGAVFALFEGRVDP